MTYVVVAFALTLAAGGLWLRARGRRADRHSHRVRDQTMEMIEPVTRAIYAGGAPSSDALAEAAADPRTRNTLFGFLLFHHKLALFPPAYRTAEAFAESSLVSWLMHPNELGMAPDKIELVDEVRDPPEQTVMGRRDRWLVFRFRTLPRHGATGEDWMAGVVGPVSGPPAEQYPDAAVVWSMFRPMASATSTAHVAAVRELARKSGVAV